MCKLCGSQASYWQCMCSLTPLLTWFEHVSMLVILLNCVTLGMFQPCEDVECQSERCTILEVRLALSWDPSCPQDTQKALHMEVVSAVRHTWAFTVTLTRGSATHLNLLCICCFNSFWVSQHYKKVTGILPSSSFSFQSLVLAEWLQRVECICEKQSVIPESLQAEKGCE